MGYKVLVSLMTVARVAQSPAAALLQRHIVSKTPPMPLFPMEGWRWSFVADYLTLTDVACAPYDAAATVLCQRRREAPPLKRR